MICVCGRMRLLLFSSLLGAAACVAPGTTAGKTDSAKAAVTVWPPGPDVHQGETVILLCSVLSSSSSVWTYRWFRDALLIDLTSGPRMSVHGGCLFIRGVSRKDQGRYWCQAEHKDGDRTQEIQSQRVELTVRDSPSPALTLIPDSKHVFTGERFTLLCPKATPEPSSWRLRRFSLDPHTNNCTSPPGGAVTPDGTNGFVFSAVNGSSGLFWCESPEQRTSAVDITVSAAPVIISTPVSPVQEGHGVTLYCQHRTNSSSRFSFYKNKEIIQTSTTTGSNKTVTMTIDNVTQADEGFYTCKSDDQDTESEESWLSVRADEVKLTTADGAADATYGPGWWIFVLCGVVLLFLIPVGVWLVWRNRNKAKCICDCGRPDAQGDFLHTDLPVTKQDVTEVQWDLSWMEMTDLLDKNLYPGTKSQL